MTPKLAAFILAVSFLAAFAGFAAGCNQPRPARLCIGDNCTGSCSMVENTKVCAQ